MESHWYRVEDAGALFSPALLVYPERIEANIRRMIRWAGTADRLRPHVKTHKMPELIRMQLDAGLSKFKCATIAEAEMTARCGAGDVLLAYPVVGANIARLIRLIQSYPGTRFSAIADDASALNQLSAALSVAQLRMRVFLDVDCGMHRTGVEPGAKAFDLYRLIGTLPGLEPGGLHAYDGHIHSSDLAERKAEWQIAWEPVQKFRDELLRGGLPVPAIVAGGTPTFPFHARIGAVECSPGTCLLWDFGYGTAFPDLEFQVAAVVLTRVVSKPGRNRLCLDLGHKAVASENPPPRVQFLDVPDAVAVMHSEEHLVIESAQATAFRVGQELYGVPRHICPTVALHAEAVAVSSGQAKARWRIAARDRVISI